MHRRLFAFALFVAALPTPLPAQDVRLPNKEKSVKFAVLGDTGTGDDHQLAVAQALFSHRAKFPFEFVLLTGDNIYGSENPRDYERKFSIPYKPLLDGGVKFYASLGNHDNPNQRLFKPFNMNGERYYTFKPAGASARFFALDSNYIDDKQLDWLDKELAASGSDWKIMFFHHPPYSSGDTHGSAELERQRLEPIFVKHGVNLVLNGHEHFYERLKPQKGIAYFIIGNSAKLRRGDIRKTELTARGWDEGRAFLLMEIDGDELHYQAIAQTGRTIDAGVLYRVGKSEATPDRSTQPVVSGQEGDSGTKSGKDNGAKSGKEK